MKKSSRVLLAVIIISFLITPSLTGAIETQSRGSSRTPAQTATQEVGESDESEESDELAVEFCPAVRGNGMMQETEAEAAPEVRSYQEKLQEERQARVEEMVQVRNQVREEAMTRVMLQSRQTVASLSQGASFTIDPITNLVTVTTPSGQEHILYHLPDQAIERMQEVGLLLPAEDAELPDEELTEELELIATDDNLVYQLDSSQLKKLLGIFNRQVPRRIVLDDDTGTVIAQPVEGRNLLQRLLDNLSF